MVSWLTLSIATTAKTEPVVVDPQENEELKVLLAGTIWINWFMIEEDALKALYADGKKTNEVRAVLVEAQKDVERLTEEKNELQQEKYDVETKYAICEARTTSLENPPWYMHPVVWGVGGIAAGALGVLVIVNAGQPMQDILGL